MGIRVAERPEVFHVPYGPPNSEGTPEASFVDLKAHPEWVSVIPPCVGWPETRDLLQAVNAPESPFMTLAADQAFTTSPDPAFAVALTSFVMLCYATLERNVKPAVTSLAERVERRLSALLQEASSALDRRLFLDILLELQPTVFHRNGISGWSLSVGMVAYGSDQRDARMTWSVGMAASKEALADRAGLE